MASKIPLFQRSEIGPTRAGAVKPGFDLARGEGIAEIGTAISGFAGGIFDDLVATRAANEEATFQGQVNTAMEEFETFVAANPGAGYDRLGKEREKMNIALDKAGQAATTRKARQNNKNFMLRNKKAISQRTQSAMEAIRAKQELLTYQSHRKNFMNNFDRDGLIELNEDMVESGLLNPEVTAAQQELDFGIIDKAERKIAVSNSVGIGFDAWQSTVTPEDPDGDLNAAFDVIDALDVPEGDKQEIESELKTRVANRRAETKLEAQQADAKSVETINGWINKGELDGITDRINKLPLTETRKAEEIKKANAHIAAINKGNPSPYEQTDPVTYFDLRRKIELDPLSVTEADLAAVVGLGKGRVEGKDSLRPDGTKKDVGFLGVLKEAGGKDVTEFSISTDLKQNGRIIDFPTMVPTLTETEIDTMLNDIIPNNKEIPDSIVRKAEDHARKRIAEGKSVFFESKGGISISDYEKLLGMIEPGSPLKRPAVTRAQASIQRVRAAEKSIDKPKNIEKVLESERFYLGVSNDVDEWVLAQTAAGKEPTDEQIDQKTINLMRPKVDAIVLNLFERLVTPAVAEEATLQSKRFRAFEKHPAFERISDEDVEKAKEAFRLGATLQEVLDNL